MEQRELSVLMAVLFVTSLFTGIVTASPPGPGTEGNGLSENESATLWSRDADNYISQEEYRQRYGDERTAIHQLANGTDITFKRPPATELCLTHYHALCPIRSRTNVYTKRLLRPDQISSPDSTFEMHSLRPLRL
jgi:hypothetical protein